VFSQIITGLNFSVECDEGHETKQPKLFYLCKQKTVVRRKNVNSLKKILVILLQRLLVVGDRGTGVRGREPGRKGGGRSMGDGSRGGEITQHCATFCNRKLAKRREFTKNRGREPGLKGTGSLNPLSPTCY